MIEFPVGIIICSIALIILHIAALFAVISLPNIFRKHNRVLELIEKQLRISNGEKPEPNPEVPDEFY